MHASFQGVSDCAKTEKELLMAVMVQLASKIPQTGPGGNTDVSFRHIANEVDVYCRYATDTKSSDIERYSEAFICR